MSEASKPVIQIVDDTQEDLELLRQRLTDHYHNQYQVAAFSSFREAMDALAYHKLHDGQVALALVDCDLNEYSGTDFLERAGEMFPPLRRVLMAGRAEKEDALKAMKHNALDRYLTKPLQNYETDIYPVLDELLKEWQATMAFPEEPGQPSVRIIGYRWSADSHQVKDFLARNLVPYRWLEFDQPEAQRMLEAAGIDRRNLPVIFFPDGTQMTRPSISDLAEKVGLQQQADARFYDLIVVGGGPAGLSASVYGASEGLRTLLIEKEAPGGQAGASSRIDNYLGFPSGLSGTELTRRAVTQAQRFGVEILTPQEATGLRLMGNYRLVQLADGSEIASHVVLIATGVSYSRLEVPGADRLTGAGIFYGAVITEAISCRDQEVFLLGGGNSAGQAAMYLSRFASRITILNLADSLEESMSQYLIDQIDMTKNVHVHNHATITAVEGGDHLEQVTVKDVSTGKEELHPAVALFIYIGAKPRTGWLGDLVARDEQGYILTGEEVVEAGEDERFRHLNRGPYFLESCVPGVFAAGDTRHGSVKRIASSVGEGGMAVTLIHQYLSNL